MNDFQRDYKYRGFSEQIDWVSNKFNKLVGSHVSEDGKNVVVKIGAGHIKETRYGYMMIVDAHHVVFFKNWQCWGNPRYSHDYIINFNKDYYIVKEYGDFSEDFAEEPSEHLASFEGLIKLAKEQEEYYNNPENEAIFDFPADIKPNFNKINMMKASEIGHPVNLLKF